MKILPMCTPAAHGALILTLIASSAAAQQAIVLPTVEVTAQKIGALELPASTGSNLDLTPMRTPASIDIITRAQLEERGDTNLVDAITRAAGISGMAHPGNGGSSLSARGFSDTNSVMRLYDGVRQYGGVGLTFPFDTWSVDSVEVMRGPASVIYGDGAIGGVINVIPKKPMQGAIRNEIQASIGTDNTQRLGVGSAGGIDDKLSYRFDASANRSDGWVDMGQSRDASFSGALQLDATPELRLKLSYAQGRQHPMRYFGTPLVNGRQLESLREKNYNVSDSAIKFNDRWSELALAWTPSAALTVRGKLYYIASKRDYRNAETYTYNPRSGLIDRSGDTEINHDQAQTGASADASIRADIGGLQNQLAVGVELNTTSFRHTNNTYVGSPHPAAVDPHHPVAGAFFSAVPTMPRYRNKADQYAVSLEDRLMLSASWSILAGLRYDHAKIARTNLLSERAEFDKTHANLGWRIGTVVDAAPGLALYAQYAKAADPASGLLTLSAANSNFDVSTGKQLEVGIKQAFWSKRGEWTLAVYEIRKNNLLARDATNPQLRVQVGQRSSRGIEGTLGLALATDWQLDANATVLRARFDTFIEADGTAPVSRAGNVPPDVAEKLANVWLSWNFLPDWSASGGVRYVGRRYADNANRLVMPAYGTTDLALRWKAARNTTLALRATNLADKQHFTTAYYTGTQWFNGPGRRIELTANVRF